MLHAPASMGAPREAFDTIAGVSQPLAAHRPGPPAAAAPRVGAVAHPVGLPLVARPPGPSRLRGAISDGFDLLRRDRRLACLPVQRAWLLGVAAVGRRPRRHDSWRPDHRGRRPRWHRDHRLLGHPRAARPGPGRRSPTDRGYAWSGCGSARHKTSRSCRTRSATAREGCVCMSAGRTGLDGYGHLVGPSEDETGVVSTTAVRSLRDHRGGRGRSTPRRGRRLRVADRGRYRGGRARPAAGWPGAVARCSPVDRPRGLARPPRDGRR